VEIAIPSSPPRFAEPVLRVYAKDFADHALQHLPQAAKYNSIENFRNYLADKLRFNSEATRRRSANYIVSRFFPGEVYNEDLPQFAAATRGTPALGEALFYLTCRTERIVSLVAEEIVFPSIAQGGVGRTRLREYVQSKFPQSKSVEDIGQAIVRSYQFYGIGSPNRTRLNVSLREGSLVSFAYVMHLEFPEPGMYAFEKMFEGPMHKWLLWDRQWMVHQLYKLREAGLLAKVSEIDRMRQFTTKYTLAEALQHIVALAKESPE
jgi:DNA repair protein RadC